MTCNIIGIHASPRDGATAYALKRALEFAEEIPGSQTEYFELRKGRIAPCTHCDRCKDLLYCPVFPDQMEKYYEIIPKADAIILASPVCDMGISPLMAAFISRLRPLYKLTMRGDFSFKVGGALAVGGSRNGGIEECLGILNRTMLSLGMCIPGGGAFAYSGGGIWSKDMLAEGAKADETGMRTVAVMSRRVALTANLLKKGLNQMPDLTPAQMAGMLNDEERDEMISFFFGD